MKLKKIIALLIAVVTIISQSGAVFAQRVDAGFSAITETVSVRGDLNMYNTTEPITLLMLDKNASATDYTFDQIKYIAQETVDADGKYEFKFKFTGNASECKLLLNLAGQNVTDSVTEAKSVQDMLDIKINVDRNTTVASAVAEINNRYDISGQNCKMIFAFYGTDNKLLSVQLTDTQSVAKGETTTLSKENITIPKRTKTIKAMVWDSLETLIPLCKPEVRGDERIVCWGDSLTEGSGSGTYANGTPASPAKPYPTILAELSGREVINKGIGGQTATQIAVRQGGVKLLLTEAVTIPEGITPVKVKFETSNGIPVVKRDDYNIPYDITNVSCRIGDIDGILKCVNNETDEYEFTRTAAGAEYTAPKGSQIVSTDGLEYKDNSIAVIWIGTNGGWTRPGVPEDYNTLEAYTTMIDDMIEQLDTKEYVVVSLTRGSNATDKEDAILEEKYGERFIKLRQLMTTDPGAEKLYTDKGITLTEEDKAAMQKGVLPQSILQSGPHFYAEGYRIVAELIYIHMVTIGLL